MTGLRRAAIGLGAGLMLAAFAPIAGKGEAALDGTWRFERLAGGVRHPGTLRMQGGVGRNTVSFMHDGVRHTVSFDVRAELSPAGVVFRPISPVRHVEPEGYGGYSPDVFTCRWTQPTLTCTNVDEAGQADDAEFTLTRAR